MVAIETTVASAFIFQQRVPLFHIRAVLSCEREGEERKEEKEPKKPFVPFSKELANTPLLVARLGGLCRTSWMVVELNEKQRQKHRR